MNPLMTGPRTGPRNGHVVYNAIGLNEHSEITVFFDKRDGASDLGLPCYLIFCEQITNAPTSHAQERRPTKPGQESENQKHILSTKPVSILRIGTTTEENKTDLQISGANATGHENAKNNKYDTR